MVLSHIALMDELEIVLLAAVFVMLGYAPGYVQSFLHFQYQGSQIQSSAAEKGVAQVLPWDQWAP